MAETYGPNITVARGETHDYLGMDLDFSTKGVAKISMIKYLRKVISDFPEEIKGTSVPPYTENLFKVRDPGEECVLPQEQARDFHHAVAQLLF